MTAEAPHIPVLVDEVLQYLDPQPKERFLDGTLGAGGHALEIVPRLLPGGEYVGLDRDPEILQVARSRLEPFGESVRLFEGSFGSLHLDEPPCPGGFDGILLDLGVSSLQLDRPERGFSFTRDGPLDMRMEDEGETAAQLIQRLREEELADVIYQYGEERHSRRIARAIKERLREGPIERTLELAEVVKRALPRRKGRPPRIHPATRTFQALRIAVNQELEELETILRLIPELLRPGGRVAIISFHSLEDRPVKHGFRDEQRLGRLELLTRKPVTATAAEKDCNPRARSAKLRAARRTAGEPR